MKYHLFYTLKFKYLFYFLLAAIFVTVFFHYFYDYEDENDYDPNETIDDLSIENELNNVSFTKPKTNAYKIQSIHSVYQYHYTTVVSVYFSFSTSKHSPKEYKTWMRNMLISVQAPLVVLTDRQSKNFILNQRLKARLDTYLVVYDDIWQLMNELEIDRGRSYIKEYMKEQRAKDPEKGIHNPNLYAIWNLKSFICNKMTRENPFNSSFFIYSDMGSWRHGMVPYWPDNYFVRLLNDKLNDRVLFGQINHIEEVGFKQSSIFKDLVEGTFFAGSKKAIQDFYTGFYKLHDQRMDAGLFVGKDQTMMNLYAFLNERNKVVRLRTWDLVCNRKRMKFDKWFFYQRYFAIENLYACVDTKFSLLINL
jgi:hypothetical protein